MRMIVLLTLLSLLASAARFHDAAEESPRPSADGPAAGGPTSDERPRPAFLSPAASLAKFDCADDLAIDLVLAEPEIQQPVSISFDERGRLWVIEYVQYPEPAGLRAVSRDEYLRTVYDKIPPPPPNHFPGKDRISIHEDTDGDGRFDAHRVFVEGLSIVTSCARGRGGVWVLNPPYLLFYPDRDDDDVPDGDPEVHLAGFGLEDTHSVVNSLRFGPDGWLYAAQGSTVSARVTRPGRDGEPAHYAGQLMWRYHPESRRYEIFAEGGGNAFCVEFDAEGRLFSGNNGADSRGFHYVQGGYYQKTFRKHGLLSNPHAFGWFPAMAHEKSPRFTHAFVVYEGDTFPEKYRGNLFALETLYGRIVRAERTRDGSTFRTRDLDHPLRSRDEWFRPVDLQLGPDGALYVADFHEARIDHLAHHRGELARQTGRVYRLQAQGVKPPAAFDLRKKSTDELVTLLVSHPNRWFRNTALRLLGDRKDRDALPRLTDVIRKETGQPALEALWAIHQIGGLDEQQTLAALDHANPHVRRWAVRLAGDDRRVAPAVSRKLAGLAAVEPEAEVRSQLASTARRLPVATGLPIVKALLKRADDEDDQHIPLLSWWGIDAHLDTDREAALDLFENEDLWREPLVRGHILERIVRRLAGEGSRAGFIECARLFELAPDAETRAALLAGFEQAFEGREVPSLPDELAQWLGGVGGGSLVLGVRQGQAEAVARAIAIVSDANAPQAERMRLVRTFGEVSRPKCVPALLDLVGDGDSTIAQAALSSLGRYDDVRVAAKVLAEYPRLSADGRTAALSLLASRPAWSRSLLAAVDAGTIPATSIEEDAVGRMAWHDDPEVKAAVRRHWDAAGGPSRDDSTPQVARHLAELESGTGDPYAGRTLFEAKCANCHRLFGDGGFIGPDLTGYRRDDVRGLVVSVVDPSAEIREGFETQLVVTVDGRTVTGFLVDRDERTVVLRGTDGQNISLRREEVDEMLPQKRSLMPDGLLRDCSPQQVRDFFAYLRIAQPLPRRP